MSAEVWMRGILLGSALLVTGIAGGCTPAEARAESTPYTHAVVIPDLATGDGAARDAKRRAQHDTYQSRDAFLADRNRELVNIWDDIDRLSARIVESSPETRDRASANFETVRDQWLQLTRQLALAEQATESTWDELQAAIPPSLDRLEDTFASARQWLNQSITP